MDWEEKLDNKMPRGFRQWIFKVKEINLELYKIHWLQLGL